MKMWSPTHVQVTVQKARGLICKGKNGTNDAFVTIALGKEKFQTSVKQKATDSVEWHEKCELLIPKQGNRAEVVLTALHRNFLGVDEFLGCVHLPLSEMDVYDRPKNKWYKLKDKPGKDKNKERGDLEVKIAFIVKAGSLSDLSKKEKHKSSLGQLSQAAQSFGGSLISISSLDKRKGLKKLAVKIGHKIHKGSKHKDENIPHDGSQEPSRQVVGDADPGVISEAESDDDFTLDELSHKGSGCSIDLSSSIARSVENVSNNNFEFVSPGSKMAKSTSVTPILDAKIDGELKRHNKASKDNVITDSVKRRLSVLSSSSLSSTKEVNEDEEAKEIKKSHLLEPDGKPPMGLKSSMERIIIGKEITRSASPVSGLPSEIVRQYAGKSREELIELVQNLQNKLASQQKYQRDLEDYLDNLLLRVMETSPRILQNPYISYKAQAYYN